MRIHRCPRELQAASTRVDEREDASAGQWVSASHPRGRPRGQLDSLEREHGVEVDRVTAPALDPDAEAFVGQPGADDVAPVHGHERRDVKRLVQLRLPPGDDVGVAFAPGGVGHLGDERVDTLAGLVEAVVKADRVVASERSASA
jgi:hypothetical protein